GRRQLFPLEQCDVTDNLQQLRTRLAQIEDLRSASQLLGWDQQTMMPPRGGSARAEALATVERMNHEMFVSEETGRLIDAASQECSGAGPDSDDASLIRVTRRRWEKSRRVPSQLASELARAASLGQE